MVPRLRAWLGADSHAAGRPVRAVETASSGSRPGRQRTQGIHLEAYADLLSVKSFRRSGRVDGRSYQRSSNHATRRPSTGHLGVAPEEKP
jgi:hypothetical protein